MTQNLVERLETYKTAVDRAFNHIVITDTDGDIVYANDSVTRITGYSRQEIIGQNPRLWGGQMPKEFYKEMWHQIKVLHEPFHGEVTNKRKNGETYYALVNISPLFDDNHELMGFIGTEEDITPLKEARDRAILEKKKLEELNEYFVGRELKMMEQKREIDRLKKVIEQRQESM